MQHSDHPRRQFLFGFAVPRLRIVVPNRPVDADAEFERNRKSSGTNRNDVPSQCHVVPPTCRRYVASNSLDRMQVMDVRFCRSSSAARPSARTVTDLGNSISASRNLLSAAAVECADPASRIAYTDAARRKAGNNQRYRTRRSRRSRRVGGSVASGLDERCGSAHCERSDTGAGRRHASARAIEGAGLCVTNWASPRTWCAARVPGRRRCHARAPRQGVPIGRGLPGVRGKFFRKIPAVAHPRIVVTGGRLATTKERKSSTENDCRGGGTETPARSGRSPPGRATSNRVHR